MGVCASVDRSSCANITLRTPRRRQNLTADPTGDDQRDWIGDLLCIRKRVLARRSWFLGAERRLRCDTGLDVLRCIEERLSDVKARVFISHSCKDDEAGMPQDVRREAV